MPTGTTLRCNDIDTEPPRTLHAWINDGYQGIPLIFKYFLQVKGKLIAMLHSGQQSFTNASRFRVVHAVGDNRNCNTTMAESLISVPDTPIDHSVPKPYRSSVDPDPCDTLPGVPPGYAHSCGFPPCARLDSLMPALAIWLRLNICCSE